MWNLRDGFRVLFGNSRAAVIANPLSDRHPTPPQGGMRFSEERPMDIDVDVVVLSEMEQDALAELANIGVNRAAVSLRQILGEQVLLSIPAVEIISREAAARFVEESSTPKLIAVQQSFEGSFSGKALLIFPETQSLELVRSILGDKHSLEDIVTLEYEVLAEVGNIILNAFLGTIANVLGQSVRISLPTVIRGSGTRLFEDQGVVGNLVLLLYIDFTVKGRNVHGFIALLMDLPAIKSLKIVVEDFIKSVDQ
jgi:chemotaxis protein CheC